jgi:hypothetical protein
MFCGQCGKTIDPDAKFCGNCGATVPQVPTPAPVAAGFTPPPPITPAPKPAGSGSTFGANAGAQASAAASEAAAAIAAVDPQGLIARVKNILLTPKTEWPVIAGESKTSMEIYAGYVAPLALVSMIALFISLVIIGRHLPFVGTVRTPLLFGVGEAVLTFVMTFVVLFVLTLIINALAPTFGGQKDSLRALKVAAYSMTASWVASLFVIVPVLGTLIAIVGAIYGLYLLYLGLPLLMRSPQDKALGYTIVVVICAIVVYWILMILVAGGIMGAVGVGGLSAMSSSSSDSDGTASAAAVLSGMMGGKTDADKARMKDAMDQLTKMGAQADQASKVAKATGADPDAAAASKVDMNAAMAAVGTMMSGGKDVKPVDFHALKDMLPTSIAGLARTDASGQSGEAMGMKGSSATANYADSSGAHLTVEITDIGSLAGLAGLASKFDPNMEKETDTGYERTSRVDGQLVHQQYDRQAKSGSFDTIINNRFTVNVNGSSVPPETLIAAIKAIDTGKLVALAKQ